MGNNARFCKRIRNSKNLSQKLYEHFDERGIKLHAYYRYYPDNTGLVNFLIRDDNGFYRIAMRHDTGEVRLIVEYTGERIPSDIEETVKKYKLEKPDEEWTM